MQGVLKIKNYISRVDVLNNDHASRTILNSIFWLFAFLSFLYILFLGNMVVNIVERRSLESEARTLTTEVANLELSYLAMSNDVDIEMSYALGFKEIKPSFATRKPISDKLGLSSKFNNNEI
ncbi:MAG: hypothetical protein AAB510_00970 [Patescibacteria group bacterium]